ARRRPPPGAARVLVLPVAPPLVAAALLALVARRAATAVHALAAVVTLAVGLTGAATPVRGAPAVALDGVLRADALSGWMIAVIVAVTALAAAEAPRYAREGSPRLFYPLFHLMVFTMLLAVSTDDVGVMWVAVEGTTLASVFLVNFERTRASLEAAYKYLLICSVGIAIAFVGTVLVYYAEAVRQHGVGAYAIVRFKPIVDAAAGPAFARRILIALGLLSLAVAAAFLWNPGNYKRMLAYSSVEHIGLVGLGLGFGGALGVSGALLHVA